MRVNAIALPEPELLTEPKVRSLSVAARWLTDGDYRMDATFYADEAVTARYTIGESGFEIKLLGDPYVTQQLFWPSRFKRIYTDNPNEGYPFLQASQALMFQPKSERWLARSTSPDSRSYFVKEGWILITRSGVVGRCVIVGNRLSRFFLSEDLIRIIPKLPAGYLYAYLSSWIGQALIMKEQYGMTVTHLEPQHLARVPIPLLTDNDQQAIHEQIITAYRLRDEANDLLDQADELLHTELGLSRFNESRVPYLFGSIKPKAFILKLSEVAERFDASFHLPIAKAAVAQMHDARYSLIQVGNIANVLLPTRFKRIYVASEYGVPFLQGSHIPLMKPYDLKYLSRLANQHHINECLIHSNWILLTRSGTVGRLILVPSTLDGWAASEHCLRIIPDIVHPGYIATFLMTPYGQHQLTSKIYGGVVDELTEDDTAAVYLPDAPMEVQERIGTLVARAFEKKEEANTIENRAIAQLENMFEERQR